ncbi:MAG: tetratricopeptide repeat protein, partial [Armatimonadetes bacterium]|nr:tetratricopeptide repeat protein [Armatimonadota bacterium]
MMRTLTAGLRWAGFAVALLALGGSVLAQGAVPIGEAAAHVRRARCDAATELVRAAAAQEDLAGGRAAFITGVCLLNLGRPEEAERALLTVPRRHALLAGHALYYAAEARFRQERFQEAADAFGQAAAAVPEGPLPRRAMHRQAAALLQAGRAAAAVEVVRRLLRLPGGDDDAAWLLLGQAQEAAGRSEEAARAYVTAWWAFPRSPRAAEALLRLRHLKGRGVPSPALSPELHLRRGLALFQRQAYREAADALRTYLAARPNGPQAADAAYRLGRAAFALGRTAEASATLAQAVGVPGEHQPAAMYWLGRTLLRMGRRDPGNAVLRRLMQEHPRSEWAGSAYWLLAVIHEERQEWDRAEALFR